MLACCKVNDLDITHELPSQECHRQSVTAHCIVTGVASGSCHAKHAHLTDPRDLSWLLLSCLHEHLAPGMAWSNAVCPVVPASHIPTLAAIHTHTHTDRQTHTLHMMTRSPSQGGKILLSPGKRKLKPCTISSLRQNSVALGTRCTCTYMHTTRPPAFGKGDTLAICFQG